jgi:hypothetical protein
MNAIAVLKWRCKMGKGATSGDEMETTTRFADYIEGHHAEFLNIMAEKAHAIMDLSPFSDFTDVEVEIGFFGSGYVLSSFPSLYDMYGKFMAGLDVEYLFDQAFEGTTDGVVVHNLISAHATELSDDLENTVIPRYEVGMRDINAVMSGTFAIGKAMLETKRIKEVSKFDAELRYRMIPVAVERWKAHLEWNKQVTATYMDILKLYVDTTLAVDDHNYEMHAKNSLWPFTVLDYERVALGCLTGATKSTQDVAGAGTRSKVGGAIGGAMYGASAGMMVGGPWGAAVGGVLGVAAGLFG